VASFPQVSPLNPRMHLSPIHATCSAHFILLDLFARTVFGEEFRSFSTLPCYNAPLSPKYSPQHPILKHPQPTFLPQCKRPSFTPIQNQTKQY
jgi:hypothetical protein